MAKLITCGSQAFQCSQVPQSRAGHKHCGDLDNYSRHSLCCGLATSSNMPVCHTSWSTRKLAGHWHNEVKDVPSANGHRDPQACCASLEHRQHVRRITFQGLWKLRKLQRFSAPVVQAPHRNTRGHGVQLLHCICREAERHPGKCSAST